MSTLGLKVREKTYLIANAGSSGGLLPLAPQVAHDVVQGLGHHLVAGVRTLDPLKK